MSLLRRGISAAVVLGAVAIGLAPSPVFADGSLRVEGAFTVSYMRPSAVDYCAASGGNLSIEAQGIGSISGVGPLLLTVKKCLTFSDATYAGTFQLRDGAGGTLTGRYAGVQNAANANGFGPFQGTLTVASGTGRLRHVRGSLTFTAVASPASTDASGLTVNGMAYYLVRGSLSSAD
jgi:hypothetical protein